MNSYYLGVDLNLPEKIEIIRLKQKLGYSGFGLYIEIMLRLAQAKDYKLPCDYELLAYQARLDISHVKSAIEDFNLFTLEDNFFWCEDTKNKMLKLENKIVAAKKAGEASGKARNKEKTNDRSTTVQTDVEPPNERKLNNKRNKIKEINKDLSKTSLEDLFFEKFNLITGKKLRVFDEKAKRQLHKRLEEGFTLENIFTAISNASENEFLLQSKLSHLTPEFITRLDKLQKYLDSNCNQVKETSYKVESEADLGNEPYSPEIIQQGLLKLKQRLNV